MRQQIERLKDYVGCAHALGKGPREKCSILWRELKNVRVRLSLAAHEPARTYALETIYGPLHFRDNFGDITNLVGLFYRNVYRVGVLAGAGVVLDVGANIGLAAAWIARHNPGRKLYCFEPLRANAEMIRLNCPEAEVVQMAIGARRSRVSLQVDRHGVMASSIPCRWETTAAEFEVITLDDFVEERGLDEIALIKIDAEGMETEILKGAGEALRRTHGIVMETHGLARHQESCALLRRAGFCVDAEEFDGATGLVFASRCAL